MKNLFLLLLILTISSCSSKKTAQKDSPQQDIDVLATVHKLMSGHFSSAEQAENDTNYFSINLVMTPIWGNEKDAKYLYVEQAVTSKLEKPYRQRIYKLILTEDNEVESQVFELPDPKKFVHAWEKPNLFKSLTPASLIIREGCAVFLSAKDDCYSGSTKNKECKSTLYGATYATSAVEVCEDKVTSWDQGWDDSDEQIWGAENGAYIFNRIKYEGFVPLPSAD